VVGVLDFQPRVESRPLPDAHGELGGCEDKRFWKVMRALAALLLMIVVRSIERRQAALEFTHG